MDKTENDFSKVWNNSDAKIIVGSDANSRVFHVHTDVLTIASPVFDRMLSSQFKEGISKVIRFPGRDPDVVLEMLSLLYPVEYRFKDSTDYDALLEMADEFDIKHVKCIVDEHLSIHGIECSLKYLLLAEKHDLKKTIAKHVSTCSKIDQLLPGDWSHVSADTKLKILAKKVGKICEEERPKCTEKDCYSGYCSNEKHKFLQVDQELYKSLRETVISFSQGYHEPPV